MSIDDVSIPNVTNDPVVNQPAGTPAVCHDLDIATGAVVTIAANSALTVGGTLTNPQSSGLVIKPDGSLIQNSSAVQATMERDISGWGVPTASHGWHFLSSPVAAQSIDPAFTSNPPGNYDFYSWWEATNVWVNYKNTATPAGMEYRQCIGGDQRSY
jgi:hypothetical protein